MPISAVLAPNNYYLRIISKNFKISQRFNAQLRAGFFHAFNPVSFSSFDNFTEDSPLRRRSGDYEPRTIQFGLKLYF
ncbi:MAG: hypothetical protein ACRD3T_20055 [Terriglobia bacterium]